MSPIVSLEIVSDDIREDFFRVDQCVGVGLRRKNESRNIGHKKRCSRDYGRPSGVVQCAEGEPRNDRGITGEFHVLLSVWEVYQDTIRSKGACP